MPPAAIETPATPANVATSQTGGSAVPAPASAAPVATPSPAPAAAAPTAPVAPAVKRFAAPQEPAAEAANPAAAPSGVTPPAAAAAAAEAKTSQAPAPAAKPGEWTLKAPQGVEALPELVTTVEAFAKQHGIPEAGAQAILTREVEAGKARAAAAAAEVANVSNAWYDQSMAHPEIGGANAPAAEKNVNRALLAFAKPDERKVIVDSGFLNNPIFRAIMHRAGLSIPQEGGLPPVSGAPPARPLSPQERIYGRR